MNKVIVIGTSHKEGGACTSTELIKIIEKFSPDVIFCEAPNEKFEAMLEATDRFNTPEILVLREIIKEGSIEVMPIDLNNEPFDGRLELMLELFSKKIKDYHYASMIQAGETNRLGFPFLNSEDCDQIHKDKSKMEKNFVNKVNDLKLSETYNDWLQWNDDRENHWINKIHGYIVENRACNTVFLVGAAHRVRLMEKIEKAQHNKNSTPNWDFYPFS